ncbi:SigB/SigF/SigG family RNA polymerase sigma factor [Kitasatospora sp. NPDC059146]|uniref:SigB/SigF/SigG family RNA polymerase sigma factor n=1 Tax=unclassified Kitasatospora TaxID=2633591 RepID=UPI0036A974FE
MQTPLAAVSTPRPAYGPSAMACERPGEPADLPEMPDPYAVRYRDARDLSRTLLGRLTELEKDTPAHSHVRGALIELNLSLVRFAARRLGTRPETYEEVLQVGTIGLINAVDRFDPARGVEFASFAMPTIVGEIKHFFRDSTWAVHVPRRLQDLRSTLADARAHLEQNLGRTPSMAELAEHLSIGPADVSDALTAANASTAASLDALLDAGSRQADLERGFGFDDARLPLVDELLSLRPLIAGLTGRERLILHLRFIEELPQTAIAQRLDISQMQVSRLLSRILSTLRTGLIGEQATPRP